MSALAEIIRQRIAATGSISVADYMELALAHPEHGYYRKQDPLGARGDFITAPEISQIFGELIGIWCAQVWMQMGGGPFSLVELGPGRGTLMGDALRATKKIPEFHDSLTIHMVETSPTLAHAQYQRLRHEHPRIEWLDHIDELPDSPTILIANEFFDALPIKQFIMTEDGVRERRVAWDEASASFVFVEGPAGLQLAKSGQSIAPGTVMEQCPAARSIMRTLAARIKDHGGAALVIDYGYLGEAHHDTLQALSQHKFHPVLRTPGDADLTAHVDFSTLMAIARDAGLQVGPLLNQGQFLVRMGAEMRAEMLLKHAQGHQRDLIITGLQRLISPQAMGELFKVMACASHADIELPGFAL
ncbi:MAG: methyltransferase [Azospirillum brasilense]|nr:MAG: methyltransferase [Azospirillum brasilense]